MSKRLASNVESGYKVAERLMRTEITNTYAQATLHGYEQSGIVKEYEYLAYLDKRTSSICRDLDGKKFKVKDAVTGLNYPPMHVNCRSTTLANFNDEEFNRVVRDPETREVYRFNDRQSYEQWKGNNFKPSKVIDKSIASNVYGEAIEFDLGSIRDKFKTRIKKDITSLSNEYKTRLIKVQTGKQQKHEAGYVGLDFAMNLSSKKTSVITHEFAHSMAMSSADKLGITEDVSFRKEIEIVRRKYNKAKSKDRKYIISSYADESIDEFMAEAFTLAKLHR